jgi:hypothetical protein
MTVGGERFRFEIGTSLRSIERTLTLLGALLLGLIPVVIAMACVGGAWLSQRALKPVDRITMAARGIGIDNLSQRLRTPQTGDELERFGIRCWGVWKER